MRKRYLIVVGLLAACVCLTVAVLAMLPRRSASTRDDLERNRSDGDLAWTGDFEYRCGSHGRTSTPTS